MSCKSVDKEILANTTKYAKKKISDMAHQNVKNSKALNEVTIYVPDEAEAASDQWDAAIVDGLTQSRKTWKSFELITKRIKAKSNTLVLFITQSNSTTAALQIISRSKQDPNMYDPININNSLFQSITRSDEVPHDVYIDHNANCMVVDFWNSRNMDAMLDIARGRNWNDVYVVIDEAEQGGKAGIKTRLDFILNVEKITKGYGTDVRVIFITATVANLSKSIVAISQENLVKFRKGLISKIINEKCVEHYFVIPQDTYVGPSWFVDNKLWKELNFVRQNKDTQNKEQYEQYRNEVIGIELEKLTDPQKELCLIVTGTTQDHHRKMAPQMFMIGFNVVIQMNCVNNKNFRVTYKGAGGIIRTWEIPTSEIENLAKKQRLARYIDGLVHYKTGINGVEDITMPYMIQAGVFMNTQVEDRIRQSVTPEEFRRLKVINNAIHYSIDGVRPDDWPMQPRVALIAGHIASRGNTFQNPVIDLSCTSFCFTGVTDTAQCGAKNAQKFGRACGNLLNIFVNPERKPVLVATENIVRDALANEHSLRDKAAKLQDGELVSLKELITKEEWDAAVAKSKKQLADRTVQTKLHMYQQLLVEYFAISKQGVNSFTLKDAMQNTNVAALYNHNNGWAHRELKKRKLLTYDDTAKAYIISDMGVDMCKKMLQ